MCIPLTPFLYFLTTVIVEVFSQCFAESVSLRDIGMSTSRAEISSPSSLYLMAYICIYFAYILDIFCIYFAYILVFLVSGGIYNCFFVGAEVFLGAA